LVSRSDSNLILNHLSVSPASLSQLKAISNKEMNLFVLLQQLQENNQIDCSSFNGVGTVYWKKDLIYSAPVTGVNLPLKKSTPIIVKSRKRALHPLASSTPFKSPSKTSSSNQLSPSKKLNTNSVSKNDVTEADIATMSLVDLKTEYKRLEKLVSEKEKQLIPLKTLERDATIKEKISKAGDADGKVELLTEKWTQVCQKVLVELQAKAQVPDATIGQLISHFQIDPKLIRYVEELDSFV